MNDHVMLQAPDVSAVWLLYVPTGIVLVQLIANAILEVRVVRAKSAENNLLRTMLDAAKQEVEQLKLLAAPHLARELLSMKDLAERLVVEKERERNEGTGDTQTLDSEIEALREGASRFEMALESMRGIVSELGGRSLEEIFMEGESSVQGAYQFGAGFSEEALDTPLRVELFLPGGTGPFVRGEPVVVAPKVWAPIGSEFDEVVFAIDGVDRIFSGIGKPVAEAPLMGRVFPQTIDTGHLAPGQHTLVVKLVKQGPYKPGVPRVRRELTRSEEMTIAIV